ncbi:MAG: hypothetical protein R3B49_03025 [Phycisphaerales bacterium]
MRERWGCTRLREVGHNLGLVHDAIETPCELGGASVGAGAWRPDDSFETVMGVSGTGSRELVFSTPDVMVGAQPAGVAYDQAGAADAALALLDSTAVVARFRNKDLNDDGECDADQILAGTLTDCDGNGVPDDYDRDFNRNGTPDACDIAAGTSLDADLDGVPDEVEVPVLFVDASATASTESGTSWANAMTDLQDAFAARQRERRHPGDLVASGTYRPGPRRRSRERFRFANGVAVRGRFDGTEAEAEKRPPTHDDPVGGSQQRRRARVHQPVRQRVPRQVSRLCRSPSSSTALTFAGGNAGHGCQLQRRQHRRRAAHALHRRV